MLSVIIVTYNSANEIIRCLDSFGKQSGEDNDIEVIIVDNASSDGTVDAVVARQVTATIIRNDTNRGFAAAVNQGINASKGKYICLLNPDTELQEAFFSELLEFLSRISAPIVVGCRLLNPDGSNQISTWKIPTIGTLFFEMMLPYSMSLPLVTENPNRTCETATVTGAAMVFDRIIADNLGGFDEKYFLYIEDLDFCIRAKKAGYLIYYLDTARVRHIGGKSSTKSLDAFFLYYYSSKLYYFQKNGSKVVAMLASLLMYIGCTGRVIVYGFVGVLTGKRHFWKLSSSHFYVLNKILH